MFQPRYSAEPKNREAHKRETQRAYTRTAGAYDQFVRRLPFWRRWLRATLPHVQGPRVLEVSFGTGYLLTQYANSYTACGVDLNRALIKIAQRNLARAGTAADLQQADVLALPYASGSFDTVVNTMAFTAYADGTGALAELKRVLRPGGVLVMVDVSYPADGNRIGTLLTKFWAAAGDIIRHMPRFLQTHGFTFTDAPIGACGSIHLYVARSSS